MQENTVEWLLLEKNEQGMDALLLHYGPLMRYIIAPILQNPQDREDCLSEVSMRVWEKIGQFDGECDVTRSVSKMTEIEGRGGKRWDKPKKAEKSRDCGGGKF